MEGIKRLVSLCLSLALTLALVQRPASAAEIPLSAKSAVLMHTSGEVIYSLEPDARLAPASVTKIMTLLLVMEAIESGSLSYDDTVVGSAHAASMGGSQIWLKEGEKFTVREMIKCVAVASANDCAVALAEHIAGSEEAFVAMMNKRAAELGMENTAFVNSCGLEAEGHFTSALDIAIMSNELMTHKEITEFTTIWTDTIRDGAFGLTNTNRMIRSYTGMVGLKTGYTSQAGYCLSGVAERDGMTLIAVVMGEKTSEQRNKDVAALLNYGFANYAQTELSADEPLMPVPVELGTQDSVGVRLESPGQLLIEKSRINSLEKKVELVKSIDAPVKEGDELGSFSVYSDGELIMRAPIAAAESVGKKTAFDIWLDMLSLAFMRE